nr:hypothetical protein [Micromonospora sp. DSM 115978]
MEPEPHEQPEHPEQPPETHSGDGPWAPLVDPDGTPANLSRRFPSSADRSSSRRDISRHRPTPPTRNRRTGRRR